MLLKWWFYLFYALIMQWGCSGSGGDQILTHNNFTFPAFSALFLLSIVYPANPELWLCIRFL